MSIVLITSHDENIYSITEKEAAHIKKSPRYVSKYREPGKTQQKRKDLDVVKPRSYGIMGPPPQDPPEPSKFLRKHTREQEFEKRKAEAESTACCRKTHKLPPVPQLAELKKQNDDTPKSKKDFITENIKYVIRKKPKEPEKRVVIDRYGDRENLNTGLEPRYIYSSVFGRTPVYMERLIKDKQKQAQLKKDALALAQPKCRYITREERENLLAGLKQNWEELQKQYQGLPILTDTIPKILRKSKMEADLKQLEKDIVLIERHPYIYVYDDNIQD